MTSARMILSMALCLSTSASLAQPLVHASSPVGSAQKSQAGAAAKNEDNQTKEAGFANGSFVVVPIPINDPTFGAGLALGGGYLFKLDDSSDTSFIGLGAVGTDKGSYAAGLGGSFSWDSKRYSLSLLMAGADLTYDLFVLGKPIRVEQDGSAFQGEFRYGFSETLSAGFTASYLNTRVSGLGGVDLPPQLADQSDLAIASLGLVAKRDTRDDSFYPTSGSNLDLALTYSEEVDGGNLSYTSARLSYGAFWSLGERSVLGVRASGCRVSESAPFYSNCLLGSEIRGFSLFEFYGLEMVTAQAEYRGRLSDRFGFVAFAGGGDVKGSGTSTESGFRYAGGLGARYRVSKDFGLDFSVDATMNDNGESYLYFYVGQFF